MVSFGVGYRAANLWVNGDSPPLLTLQPRAETKRSAGLYLKPVEKSLRQASFRFLTTSAYSLVGTTAAQSATFESESAAGG